MSKPRTVDATKMKLQITRRETLRYPSSTSTAVKAYCFIFEIGKNKKLFHILMKRGETVGQLNDRAIAQLEAEEKVKLTNLPKIQIVQVNDQNELLKRDSRQFWQLAQPIKVISIT